MVNTEEPIAVKSSIYLSEKLNLSYGFLSNLFSEVSFTSIENYIILQKIELAKNLIIKEELTLTEIAFKLNGLALGEGGDFLHPENFRN